MALYFFPVQLSHFNFSLTFDRFYLLEQSDF